jgi:hypothetical protein
MASDSLGINGMLRENDARDRRNDAVLLFLGRPASRKGRHVGPSLQGASECIAKGQLLWGAPPARIWRWDVIKEAAPGFRFPESGNREGMKALDEVVDGFAQ